MYCHNCNNRLYGTENYCPNCGVSLKEENKAIVDNSNNVDNSTEGSRSASIVLGGLSLGGVFLGIFAPISLILSIIGLVLAIKANKNVKNTIGIVLNGIGLFLSALITIFIILVICFAIQVGTNTIPDIIDTYGEPIISNNHGEDF